LVITTSWRLKIVSLAVAAVGALVLIGWALNIELLTTLLPGLYSMKANTALCFVFLGLALFLQTEDVLWRKRLSVALTFLALAISFFTLLEIAFSLNFGIDQLLILDQSSSIDTSAPGRMSGPTAISLLLLSSVALLSNRLNNAYRQIPILAAMLVAGGVFISYPFSLVFGSSLFSFTGMAIHTAVLVIVLSLILLFDRPVDGWLALFVSRDPLGESTRRLLATTLLAPFLLGSLIFYGENAGWYAPGLARSTYVVTVMLLLSVIVIYNAQRLGEAERTRSLLEVDFREVRGQLDSFVEYSPAAVFIKDVSGSYKLVNRHFEQLVNKPRTQILDKKAAAIFVGPVLEAVLDSDQRVIETKDTAVTEISVPFEDGQRTYLNTKFPLLGANGEVHSIGGIWTDISDQKLLAENLNRKNTELEASNKELEQFAYVASHDLQEPLRMVSSYMQLLEARYGDKLDQDAKEFIDYAVDGANRMQRLIQDLLAFSRVGTRGKAPEPVQSSASLAEALQNLKLRIEESKAKITHDEMPELMADPNQLVQLFQNLIGNALKFRSQKPPEISISVKPSGFFAEFAVTDNGIGFDPKHADRIFVIFQRLNTREQYEGTGIGLAICKKIVERHGGRIWVESQPGHGATFRFTLPLAADMTAVPDRSQNGRVAKEKIESMEDRAGRLI
jgi:PAS domain S-box-containing protein